MQDAFVPPSLEIISNEQLLSALENSSPTTRRNMIQLHKQRIAEQKFKLQNGGFNSDQFDIDTSPSSSESSDSSPNTQFNFKTNGAAGSYPTSSPNGCPSQLQTSTLGLISSTTSSAYSSAHSLNLQDDPFFFEEGGKKEETVNEQSLHPLISIHSVPNPGTTDRDSTTLLKKKKKKESTSNNSISATEADDEQLMLSPLTKAMYSSIAHATPVFLGSDKNFSLKSGSKAPRQAMLNRRMSTPGIIDFKESIEQKQAPMSTPVSHHDSPIRIIPTSVSKMKSPAKKETNIALKVYYPNKDIRRFKIATEQVSFDQLQELCLKDFKNELVSLEEEYHRQQILYEFRYMDNEEDWILLINEDDWNEAKRHQLLTQQKRIDSAMKIKIAIKNQAPAPASPTSLLHLQNLNSSNIAASANENRNSLEQNVNNATAAIPMSRRASVQLTSAPIQKKNSIQLQPVKSEKSPTSKLSVPISKHTRQKSIEIIPENSDRYEEVMNQLQSDTVYHNRRRASIIPEASVNITYKEYEGFLKQQQQKDDFK